MLCIDTSGSMIGKQEMVAKSVALYMANTAASLKARHELIKSDENLKIADVLAISDFEFAKINLSKDEAYGARFYGLQMWALKRQIISFLMR